MRQYSMIQAPFRVFYSKDLYRDVIRNWKGYGFAYLLFVLAVGWSLVFLHTYNKLQHVIAIGEKVLEGQTLEEEMEDDEDRVLVSVFSQMPAVYIRKGKASIDEKLLPYVISDVQTGEPLLLIDTSGKALSLETVQAPFVMTDSKIIARSFREDITHAVMLFDFSVVPQDMVIDLPLMLDWLNEVKRTLPFSLIIIVTMSWGMMVVMAVALGALTQAVASQMNKEMDYKSCVRLASIAMTPLIILRTIIFFLPFLSMVPLLNFIIFCSPLAVLYVAIKANR